MESLLRELLSELGQIGETHPDLYDSDVREAMRAAIHHSFLNPAQGYSLPDNFSMASEEGNRLVRSAIAKYTAAASRLAEQIQLDFQGRYSAFQNDNVEDSGPEHLTYDSAFGYIPPDAYDNMGNPR